MQYQKTIVRGIGIFALLLLIGQGCVGFGGTTTTDDAMMEGEGEAMMEKDGAMMEGTMPAGQEMEEKDGMVGGDAMMEGEGEAMMEKDAAMMEGEGEAMMEKDGAMMEDKDNIEKDSAMREGTYEAYSPSKLSYANDGDVVLFFHASWCPTCRALDGSIQNGLSSIPDNTHILKVDYDNSAELKKKYGVTVQHTLVQVDAQGNMIAKWIGGNELNTVLSRVQ